MIPKRYRIDYHENDEVEHPEGEWTNWHDAMNYAESEYTRGYKMGLSDAPDKMDYYLITYKQGFTVNTVINQTPVEWLCEHAYSDPNGSTVLLFAMRITEDEYHKLEGEI